MKSVGSAVMRATHQGVVACRLRRNVVRLHGEGIGPPECILATRSHPQLVGGSKHRHHLHLVCAVTIVEHYHRAGTKALVVHRGRYCPHSHPVRLLMGLGFSGFRVSRRSAGR
eukprot:3759551-Pyramimonas_sp.AAC.1